jgi:DNA-binding IscR family transcriptional regulator
MNLQTRFAIDARILGSGALQERFAAYVEVLGYIVQRAPRPVTVTQLADMSNRTGEALRRRCRELCHAGILKRGSGQEHRWSLVKAPNDVTLADIFRCSVAGGRGTGCSGGESGARTAGGEHDIDVLLTQALLTVDDDIYKRLRTFSLDRLKAGGAAAFPARHLSLPPFAEVENA